MCKAKSKVVPLLNKKALCHEDLMGSSDIASPLLISELDGAKWLASRLYRFTPGQSGSDTHWASGPQSKPGRCREEKNPDLAGNRNPSFQPHRYTEWAISVSCKSCKLVRIYVSMKRESGKRLDKISVRFQWRNNCYDKGRGLRGDWILVMLATIRSRTFCLLVCCRKT
jgi:hypothetical protein